MSGLGRGPIVAALLAAAWSVAAGCNFIVGAGDYSVGGDASALSDASGMQMLDGGDSGIVPGEDAPAGDGRATHVGSSDAGGRLGDPCTRNAQCAAGTCDGLWCTQPCNSNAVCGMNSAGESNYCVVNANSEYVCAPGCTGASDCQAYPQATCQPISGVAESVCTAAQSSGDGGTSGLSVGDPCTGSAACGQGSDSCNGSWCVAACTSASDTSCGYNSLGVQNYCVINGSGNYICFPGCTTNADCTPVAGTTCQPIGSGGTGSICAGTNGDVGDPCSTATTSPWSACAAGTTCEGTWCNTTCASSTDTSCGSSTAGINNDCVANTGGTYSCFPGCTTGNDCAPYAGTFCQQIYGGGAGYVCAASGGKVGDACNSNSDCKQAGSTCAGSWCTAPCTSSTDTSCGTDSEGLTNYCVQDSTTLVYDCFPGCNSDLDCTPYPGASCLSTGTGSQTVCSF